MSTEARKGTDDEQAAAAAAPATAAVSEEQVSLIHTDTYCGSRVPVNPTRTELLSSPPPACLISPPIHLFTRSPSASPCTPRKIHSTKHQMGRNDIACRH